jgi:hypothetical protein
MVEFSLQSSSKLTLFLMRHFIATSSSTSFLLPCKQKLLTASTVAVAVVVVVAAAVGESIVEESEHKLDKILFEFHTEEHCNKN